MTKKSGWLPGCGLGCAGILVRIILIVLVAIFDAVLKAVGIWKAAPRIRTARFECLLIFNTAGLLPIIYFLTGGRKPEALSNPG